MVPPSRMGNSGAGVGLGKGVDVGGGVAVAGETVAGIVGGTGVVEVEQATTMKARMMLGNNRFIIFSMVSQIWELL